MNDNRYHSRMEKFPVFNDTHQVALPLCVDPLMTLHLYPEPVPQPELTYLEDMTNLSFATDQSGMGQLYSNACKFPYQVPFPDFGSFDVSYGPSFIRKRNERERQRVKCVNEGYTKLRCHLPMEYSEKRFSKVETLRAAIKYIKYLQSLLYCDSTKAEMCNLEPGHAVRGGSKSQTHPTYVGFITAE